MKEYLAHRNQFLKAIRITISITIFIIIKYFRFMVNWALQYTFKYGL